jgi:hypothetical protein
MELIKRKSIADIFQIKTDLLQKIDQFQKLDTDISKQFEELNGYSPFYLQGDKFPFGENREEKYVDRTCWQYLIRLFELEKYMLCTDYENMQKQIDGYDFPVFTVENAEGYIEGLKDIIYNNVRTMMKSVYERITEQTYYTGSSYSTREKKKRNNNGIDGHFIITTGDYSRVYGYYNSRPTITDDLEKLCYILNGKSLPEKTLIRSMSKYGKENGEAENEYMKVKLCKNGNTHYWIEEGTRNKLNIYGADPSKIGENIKIKVFDKAS